jgi:hypothetical protein
MLSIKARDTITSLPTLPILSVALDHRELLCMFGIVVFEGGARWSTTQLTAVNER